MKMAESDFFPDFLDAANYLSKDGWYLSQINGSSSDLWIMAREVED